MFYRLSLVVFLLSFSFLISPVVFSKDYYYEHEFRGIKPGVSYLNGVNKIHGTPLDFIDNAKNYISIYSDFRVSTLKPSNVVKTIIIFDENYKTVSGVSIGDSYSNLIKTTNFKWIAGRSVVVDFKHGIVFNLRNDKVVNIVLTYYLSDDKIRINPPG